MNLAAFDKYRRWTPAEDALVLTHVQASTHLSSRATYRELTAVLDGRTVDSIENRYHRLIGGRGNKHLPSPSLSPADAYWTAELDQLALDATRQHWPHIAWQFPGKTQAEVRNRRKTIQRNRKLAANKSAKVPSNWQPKLYPGPANCLRCQKPFQSFCRRRNRLCERCNETLVAAGPDLDI